MKAFIKRHINGAGKWIYQGYYNAWEYLGYQPVFYDNILEVEPNSIIMAVDADIRKFTEMSKLAESSISFLFAQPNEFPSPWGEHPNWQCHCPDHAIKGINELDNVFLWTFGMKTDWHHKWKKVHYVPLAFDSVAYKPEEDPDSAYEVCFIGGWADNGFNEKAKYLTECRDAFQNSELSSGIFINQDISHQDECNILYNSKVAINIHDQYQKDLQLDTNERTFKSLGLTGVLVSDYIKAIKHLRLPCSMAESLDQLVYKVKEYVYTVSEEDLQREKRNVRKLIENEHTYIKRVEQLLKIAGVSNDN